MNSLNRNSNQKLAAYIITTIVTGLWRLGRIIVWLGLAVWLISDETGYRDANGHYSGYIGGPPPLLVFCLLMALGPVVKTIYQTWKWMASGKPLADYKEERIQNVGPLGPRFIATTILGGLWRLSKILIWLYWTIDFFNHAPIRHTLVFGGDYGVPYIVVFFAAFMFLGTLLETAWEAMALMARYKRK